MTQLTQKAIAELPDRLSSLPPDQQEAVARFLLEGNLKKLVGQTDEVPLSRRPGIYGSAQGKIWMADGFDEPLADLEPYMF